MYRCYYRVSLMIENRLKKIKSIVPVIAIFMFTVLCISGCNKKSDFVSKQFFAMDTWMEIHLPASIDETLLNTYFEEIEALIRELEGICSVTSPVSDLYRLNNSTEETVTELNSTLLKILFEAEVLEDLTNGAFCDKLYSISREWGFTTGNYKVPDSGLIEDMLCEIREAADNNRILITNDSIKRPVGICFDLGGIAKGYATDMVVSYLKEKGINDAIINLGGNIFVLGTKADGSLVNVGITDPFDESVLGTLALSGKAVVTSGNYERYFESDGKKYHHIIDSKTGYPADNGLVSVTIIAEDASYADALSTALFVMGLEDASEFWRQNGDTFDVIFVSGNKDIYYTGGIAEVFKCNKDYKKNVIK